MTMDNHSLLEEVTGNITSYQSAKESFTFRTCVNDEDCFACHGTSASQAWEPAEYDQHEHELFFDMDIALPFSWRDPFHLGSAYLHSLRNVNSFSDQPQEFEFRVSYSENWSSSNGFISSLSPADDLFYKGQLLPLHLPPRQLMVERLSSTGSISSSLQVKEEEGDDGNGNASAGNSGLSDGDWKPVQKEIFPFPSRRSLFDDRNTDKERNSINGRSRGSCSSVAVRGVQDAIVFPDCYKDPALQMLQQNINCAGLSRGYNARPSIGWRVILPGSRRWSNQKLDLLQESFHGCNMRKSQRWGFSIFKLRASASFFKSLFHGGELGRFLVHHKDHHRRHKGSEEEAQEEREEEEDGEVEEANMESYGADGGEYITVGVHMQTLKAAGAQAERERIIRKAKAYLRKYVRLFKSMYVTVSPAAAPGSHENSRDKLTSSAMAAGAGSVTCSSSSCRTRQGKSSTQSSKQMRTAASSSRRRPRGKAQDQSAIDCFQHGGILSSRLCGEATGCNSIVRTASYPEVENSIQGAIAHCKKSSSLSR